MKNDSGKAGPLIIGAKHAGTKNAEEVIACLEKKGLTEGQLVALEGYSRHEKIDLDRQIKQLDSNINETKIFSTTGPEEARNISEIWIAMMEYKKRLLTFLAKKKARVTGWDIFSERGKSIAPRRLRKLGNRFKLMAGPIRNRIGAKSITVTNPDFVICGANHAREIAKKIPNRGVIELSPPSKLVKKYEVIYRRRMLARKTRRAITKLKRVFRQPRK